MNPLFLLLFFQFSACKEKEDHSFIDSINLPSGGEKIPGPSGLALKDPAFSPGNDPTPTIEVSGFQIPGNGTSGVVALYTDRFCLKKIFEKRIGPRDLGEGRVDLTLEPLEDGAYSFYAKTLNNKEEDSQCSTLKVEYVLETKRPPTPKKLVLEQPTIIPSLLPRLFRELPIGDDPRPIISVSPVEEGSVVSLYEDETCSLAPVISATVGKPRSQDSEHSILLALTKDLDDGLHVFYAKAANSFDSSLCSRVSLSYIVETGPPPAPSGIRLVHPDFSPGSITTPIFLVTGINAGNRVGLYTDSSCDEENKRAEVPVSLNPGIDYILLESSSLNDQPTGIQKTYSFYVKAENSKGVSPCSSVKVDYILDQIPPTAPLTLTLTNPAQGNRGSIPDPTIRVGGVSLDDRVVLYTDSDCSEGFQVGSDTAQGAEIDITTSQLAIGNYTFYAKAFDPAGNPSTCSTESVEYIRDRGQTPSAPTKLSLQDPETSPGENQTPTIRVEGINSMGMDNISLHTESSCGDDSQVAEALVEVGNTVVDLTPEDKLLPGSYTFYAKASNSSGASSCSTASVVYDLEPDLYNKTPVGEIDISGFWVNVRAVNPDSGDVAATYIYKEGTFGYTEKDNSSENNLETSSQCFIDVKSEKENILCFVDIPEGILFTHDLKFQYNMPPKICAHFEQNVPWHWNVESGRGPGRVEITTVIPHEGEETTRECKAFHRGRGRMIDCTDPDFGDELSFGFNSKDYINGPKCAYDKTDNDGDNCCFGEYKFKKTTITIDEDDNETREIGREDREWGGNARNCIGGPGRENYAWDKYLENINYPATLLTVVPLDEETKEPMGLNGSYQVPNAFRCFNNSGFSIAANYFTSSNFQSDKQPDTLPYRLNPPPPPDQKILIPMEISIPEEDKNPHPVHSINGSVVYGPKALFPKDRSGDFLGGYPYYSFRCLDKANEVKHEINIMVREWNTKEGFESYKRTYVEYNEELVDDSIQTKTKKTFLLARCIGFRGGGRR